MEKEVQKVIVAGVVLGLVAALVVWWLERFEMRRLTAELRQHLDTQSEEFRNWLGGQQQQP